jgi:hypothetical protein
MNSFGKKIIGQCSFQTAPLALIYYVWRIESEIYGPCWHTIFHRSKFLDFIIISVLYRCSIIYSTNDPHRCPLFVLRNTIQRGTGLLMIFINHFGKALARFTVNELFGVKMTPWFLKMTPCSKVNGATGPPLKFSGINTDWLCNALIVYQLPFNMET